MLSLNSIISAAYNSNKEFENGEPGILKQQTEADPAQIVGVKKIPGSIC